MIFGYQSKLNKYKECVNFLNDNIDVTRKMINILKYARSNELVKYNVSFLGEIEAIYDFYYSDMIKTMNRIKNVSNEEEKNKLLLRAESDRMLLDEISEDGKVLPIFNQVYKVYLKYEYLEPSIKEEDKVPLKNNSIKR